MSETGWQALLLLCLVSPACGTTVEVDATGSGTADGFGGSPSGFPQPGEYVLALRPALYRPGVMVFDAIVARQDGQPTLSLRVLSADDRLTPLGPTGDGVLDVDASAYVATIEIELPKAAYPPPGEQSKWTDSEARTILHGVEPHCGTVSGEISFERDAPNVVYLWEGSTFALQPPSLDAHLDPVFDCEGGRPEPL